MPAGIKALLFCWLAAIATAHAAPFLICDPYPVLTDTSLNPVVFLVTGVPGGPFSSNAFVLADGSVELHFDLGSIPNGSYSITVAAVNVFGGSSPASPPFPYIKGAPSTPANLRVSP